MENSVRVRQIRHPKEEGDVDEFFDFINEADEDDALRGLDTENAMLSIRIMGTPGNDEAAYALVHNLGYLDTTSASWNEAKSQQRRP